tara:strand:+ start:2329 stop:4074 length:1746 start_codon:yes stop_codon:yes gene_type:complete
MKKNWGIAVGLLTLLLIAGGATFANRQALATAIKGQRSSQHLKKAEKAERAGNFSDAQQLANAAFQLNPSSLEVLRFLLTTSLRNSEGRVLSVANSIFIHPGATAEDRARCLGIYLAARDFRLFRSQLEALSEADMQNPDIKYLLAGYFAGQGDADAAIQILEKGPDSDARFMMLRTKLLSLSPDEAKRISGQKELARLITSQDTAISTSALRQIRSIPVDYLEVEILKPAADLWRQLRGNSHLAAEDLLALRTLEYLEVGDPEAPESKAIAQKTISELGPTHLIAAGNWLISVQQWETAYNFATQFKGDADDPKILRALFEIQLQALEATERWEEQLTLLNAPPSGIPPMRLSLSRSFAAKNLGKQSEANRHWQEAWRQAELGGQHRNSYLDLYQWARRTNEPEHATQALIEASKSVVGMLPPTGELTQFMSYLAENDRGDDLAELTHHIIRRETFSMPLVNNAIYLTEITGTLVPEAETLIKQMAERSPNTTGLLTTLILLQINRDQISEAFTVAENLANRIEVEKLPAAESVIIAGAYRLAGEENQKAELNLEQKLESLMEVEKRLFQKWFEKSELAE